ncbi:serine hydrolase domain-containing protein [Pseudonocardia yuanmonensis]|uniref:serine hydrolase domain-containing protein n=1 Tax=Pseudonocardia yuanmonensis TaxID=1095914 RepID=UPI0031F11307
MTVEQLDLGTEVDRILHRRPAVGLAVGVVRRGGLDLFAGRGLADIALRTPVVEDTVFRVGSLSKTFTAVAVMQLQEQGLLDLDSPVNDHLRAYRLIPARTGWPPATVRHVLTHTAGIREVQHPSGIARQLFGETVPAGRRVPSPAEYYRHGLRVVAEPGSRFRYTDHGFTTLGQLVEDMTGEPFDHYLREHVFGPLGMTDTDLGRSARIGARLATGYDLTTRGPTPHPDYEIVTTGAAAAYSTPRDIGRYLAALLGGGANQYGAILGPGTLATMFAPQFRPDPRVPGVGLAFFRGDAGGRLVLEHQGVVPAFTSQIHLAPDAALGLVAFTNGTRNGGFWLPVETTALFGRLLGVPDETSRTDVPQHPEVWPELCGWYLLPGPLTDVRARSMLGAGVEVLVRRGRLVFRCLGPVPALARGLPLRPDDPTDPYAFRVEVPAFDLTLRVVFGPDPATGTMAVHLDVMPLSALKQPAATNPRRWALGVAAFGATALALHRHRKPR